MIRRDPRPLADAAGTNGNRAAYSWLKRGADCLRERGNTVKRKARAIHLVPGWQKTGPTRAKFSGTSTRRRQVRSRLRNTRPADGHRWL